MIIHNHLYPVAEFKCITDVDDYEYLDTLKTFKNKKAAIAFSYLVEMTRQEDWKKLFEIAKQCMSIVLVDDMSLRNTELFPYKDFYMRTYYSNLQKYCENCYFFSKECQHQELTYR